MDIFIIRSVLRFEQAAGRSCDRFSSQLCAAAGDAGTGDHVTGGISGIDTLYVWID